MIGLALLVAGALLVWTFAAFSAGRSTGFVAGIKYQRAAERADRSPHA